MGNPALKRTPPFPYLRIATLDPDGNPVLQPGEGGVFFEGNFYITTENVRLQKNKE